MVEKSGGFLLTSVFSILTCSYMSEKYYDETFRCYRYTCKHVPLLFHLQLSIPVQVFRVEMVEIVHQIKVTTAACVPMVSLEKTVKKVRYYL